MKDRLNLTKKDRDVTARQVSESSSVVIIISLVSVPFSCKVILILGLVVVDLALEFYVVQSFILIVSALVMSWSKVLHYFFAD